jgi:hypothetical protein
MVPAKTSEQIDHDRRRLLNAGAVAAAGAVGLFPQQMMAASDKPNDIRSFRVNFPDEQLTDLRRRIARPSGLRRKRSPTRHKAYGLPARSSSPSTGQTKHDWRKIEARLNALPQFISEIDGLDIHFIHVRSTHANALPMIATHRWPGSIIEQIKIIEPLTNPRPRQRT